MTDGFDIDNLERLLTSPPYHRWLGLRLVEAELDRVVIAMPYQDAFLADVDGTYVHGGLVATLADVAGDFALISRLGYAVATIDLRVDYLRPAGRGQDLRAEATVMRCGRTVGVADVVVADGSDRQLAVARGVYSTAPPRA